MRINTGYYEGINQTSLSLQRLKAERRSKKMSISVGDVFRLFPHTVAPFRARVFVLLFPKAHTPGERAVFLSCKLQPFFSPFFFPPRRLCFCWFCTDPITPGSSRSSRPVLAAFSLQRAVSGNGEKKANLQTVPHYLGIKKQKQKQDGRHNNSGISFSQGSPKPRKKERKQLAEKHVRFVQSNRAAIGRLWKRPLLQVHCCCFCCCSRKAAQQHGYAGRQGRR